MMDDDKISIEAASHLFKKMTKDDTHVIAKVLLNGKRHPLIRLDCKELGNDGIQPIVKSLKQHAIVESLDLSSNNITSQGIRDLALAIATNKSLLHLKLDNNPIGDEGLTILAQSLKNSSTSLKSLYLSDCKLTEKGLSSLASALESNHTLVTLHLNSNKFGDTGINALLNSLASGNHTLRNLSCFQCGIGEEGGLKLLSYLDKTKFTIVNVNLKCNKISRDTIEKITQQLNIKKEKERKRKLKAEAQDLINEEAERMIKIKLKDVNDKAQKELENKLKDLGKKEQEIQSKEKVLSKGQLELKEKLKEFEKKKELRAKRESKDKDKEKDSTKESPKSSSTTKKKKTDDHITIVIAGDRDLDKELLISYGMKLVSDCKVISDSDFEKTINGNIVVEGGKSINFTFVNTSGHDRYSRLRALQYEHADAAIVVYSAFDRVSFEDLTFQWLPEINFMGKMPIFVAGMQVEKRNNPPRPSDITENEGREFAKKIGANVFAEPTSPDEFSKMINQIYKEMKKKKK